jgi:hypothetical protein
MPQSENLLPKTVGDQTTFPVRLTDKSSQTSPQLKPKPGSGRCLRISEASSTRMTL